MTLLGTDRKLSYAQAYCPVITSTIVSPVKALYSLGKIIAGVAIMIIFGVFNTCSPGEVFTRMVVVGALTTGSGFISLFYSIANFFTLGLVGFRLEGGSLASARFVDLNRILGEELTEIGNNI